MKKVVAFLLILSVILCFAGCSEEQLGSKDRTILHQYVFKGGNESWYAVLKVNGEQRFIEANGRVRYDSWETEDFSAYYKEDLSSLLKAKHLVIKCETPTGNCGESMNFPEDAPRDKVFGLHSESNGSFLSKADPVTVTVTLDGRSQSFQLTDQTSAQDKIDFLLGASPLEERAKWLELTGRAEN